MAITKITKPAAAVVAVIAMAGLSACSGGEPAATTSTPSAAPTAVNTFAANTVAQVQECISEIQNAANVMAVHYSASAFDAAQIACDKAEALTTYDGGSAMGQTPTNRINSLIGQEIMYLSFANVTGASTQGGPADTTRWIAMNGEGRAALDQAMELVTTTTGV